MHFEEKAAPSASRPHANFISLRILVVSSGQDQIEERKATGIIELVLCGIGQHLQRERTTITEAPQARMINQLHNEGKGSYVEVEAILRVRQGSGVGGVWRRLSYWEKKIASFDFSIRISVCVGADGALIPLRLE